MKKAGPLIREIVIRFVLGGTAVVLCYLVSVYSPVKFLGGVFAAFPAVMIAAVTMAGLRGGKDEAVQVAGGAISGMVGCTACVYSALYFIGFFASWQMGLAAAVAVWVGVSVAINYAMIRNSF